MNAHVSPKSLLAAARASDDDLRVSLDRFKALSTLMIAYVEREFERDARAQPLWNTAWLMHDVADTAIAQLERLASEAT